jgi:hypothetical protein
MSAKIAAVYAIHENEPIYRLELSLDQPNLIVAPSRSGKTTLIRIVQFCLGTKKVAFSEDIKRTRICLFAVHLKSEQTAAFAVRRTPWANDSPYAEYYFVESDGINEFSLELLKTSVSATKFRELVSECFSFDSTAFALFKDEQLGACGHRDLMCFNYLNQSKLTDSFRLFEDFGIPGQNAKIQNLIPVISGIRSIELQIKHLKSRQIAQRTEVIDREVNALASEAFRLLCDSGLLGVNDLRDDRFAIEKYLAEIKMGVSKAKQISQEFRSLLKAFSGELANCHKEIQKFYAFVEESTGIAAKSLDRAYSMLIDARRAEVILEIANRLRVGTINVKERFYTTDAEDAERRFNESLRLLIERLLLARVDATTKYEFDSGVISAAENPNVLATLGSGYEILSYHLAFYLAVHKAECYEMTTTLRMPTLASFLMVDSLTSVIVEDGPERESFKARFVAVIETLLQASKINSKGLQVIMLDRFDYSYLLPPKLINVRIFDEGIFPKRWVSVS